MDELDDLEDLLRARLRPDAVDPVPPAVDALILARATEAARGHRRRNGLRLVRVAIAAAAVVFVVATLGIVLWRDGERPFDVVDAYRVAGGLTDDARFDVDGDGRVNRGDADLMLARIVALDGGRH